MLLLIGLVHAEEVERLQGFHFGLGGGLGWSTWSSYGSDGSESGGTSLRTTMTMRFRLGKVVTLEPNVRGSHVSRRHFNVVPVEGEPSDTDSSDAYLLGIRTRVRLASVDRLDLVGMVGLAHERAWGEETVGDTRSTTFDVSTGAELGVSIEYWLARRVSLSAEMDTEVLDWRASRQEPDDDVNQSFQLGFAPGGQVLAHLWF